MKTPSKKLLLRKESVRSLTEGELADAAGGAPSGSVVYVSAVCTVTCRCPVFQIPTKITVIAISG